MDLSKCNYVLTTEKKGETERLHDEVDELRSRCHYLEARLKIAEASADRIVECYSNLSYKYNNLVILLTKHQLLAKLLYMLD